VPLKSYYELTKSGLVFGNIITVIGGFALASSVAGEPINFLLLIAAVLGICLVMASGCVFNNYIDWDIDAKMSRTRERVLVTGRISGRAALIFGTALGALGFLILIVFTNIVATGAALVGLFFYVVMYSLWWKRRSPFGTVIGSISGATPPVVGYAAANGRIDMAAIILFLILVVWQMPHFFAIAIRRADDYAAAGVPVLPVKRGIRATKVQMLLYIIAFIIIASHLTIFGYAGYTYLTFTLVLGLVWLGLCISGFWVPNTDAAANSRWARIMFFCSLIVLMVLFITITIGTVAGIS